MCPSLVVIPARFASTRLPGKPLLDLHGEPLILRVLARARLIPGVRLLVATDDQRIFDVVASAGGEVRMTSSACRSGLDRVAEVVALEPDPAALIINIQGDEPFIDPTAVSALIDAMKAQPDCPMATLACPLTDREDFLSPHTVKVVIDQAGRALYFSRAPIPFPRDADQVPREALRHIGVYGYRRDALLHLANSPSSELEQIEQLEQLRALSMGMPILVVKVAQGWLGVDTEADLEQARARFITQGMEGSSPSSTCLSQETR